MVTDPRPVIGITMGDPNGIGPEVAVKALARGDIADRYRPIIIGDPAVIADAAGMCGMQLEVVGISDPGQVCIRPGMVCVLQPQGCTAGRPQYGRVCARAGHAAFLAIQKAVDLALDHSIHAMVTAPIHKEAINAAGHHYPGHTEILAELTGTRDCAMMLVYDPLRVVHVTTHVAISKVSGLISTDRVLRVIELGHRCCKGLGIARPRVGVAGLNPHASDAGLFGDEEQQRILPAILQAQSQGIDVQGPIPADTLFARAVGGQFDLCIAMYHDQGHIALKLLGFRFGSRGTTVNGVNVTLGLPIIRTSVDHGTAFDIAGKGIACPDSLIQAIELAGRLTENR